MHYARSMSERDPAIARAAELLRDAEHILFITGAGMSADSGLPTYRGVGGLYNDADAEDGIPIEVCLSAGMFARAPERTWRHIRAIEQACRGAQPNAAHRILAELERTRERVWVLTQNVDGLHEAAGSRNVIAIHGRTRELHCTRCAWTRWVDDYADLDPVLPRCPDCDAVIRPRVVLFDEMLPQSALAQLQRELDRGFDAVVPIGTSALFPYIALPVRHARALGKATIEINPATTDLSALVDVHVQLGAAEAMTAIADALTD